jgi:hypothetical protein
MPIILAVLNCSGPKTAYFILSYEGGNIVVLKNVTIEMSKISVKRSTAFVINIAYFLFDESELIMLPCICGFINVHDILQRWYTYKQKTTFIM